MVIYYPIEDFTQFFISWKKEKYVKEVLKLLHWLSIVTFSNNENNLLCLCILKLFQEAKFKSNLITYWDFYPKVTQILGALYPRERDAQYKHDTWCIICNYCVPSLTLLAWRIIAWDINNDSQNDQYRDKLNSQRKVKILQYCSSEFQEDSWP